MTGLRLYKKEKLCGVTTVDSLFSLSWRNKSAANTFFAYPWKFVYNAHPSRSGKCARFLISVPKKRMRHAVDRVLMRRRAREAYRLNRNLFNAESCGCDMIFIFVADKPVPYSRSEKAIQKFLAHLATLTSESSSQ